jgi:hypothetical protein
MIYRYRPRYRPTLGPRGRFSLGALANDMVNSITSAVTNPTSPGVPAVDQSVDVDVPSVDIGAGISAIGDKLGGAIGTLFGGAASSAPAASSGMSSTAKLALAVGACSALYFITKKKRRR